MGIFTPDGFIPVTSTDTDDYSGVFGDGDFFHPYSVYSTNGFGEWEDHVFFTTKDRESDNQNILRMCFKCRKG